MTSVLRLSFLLGTAAGLAACGSYTPPATANGAPAKQTASAAAGAKEAKEIFSSLCFTCHGNTGHGDGPGAATLTPKPRTFADVAWQESVTDDHIAKTIVYGGAAVGKSPIMVANPQLKGKPEVVASLVKIVRDFRGK